MIEVIEMETLLYILLVLVYLPISKICLSMLEKAMRQLEETQTKYDMRNDLIVIPTIFFLFNALLTAIIVAFGIVFFPGWLVVQTIQEIILVIKSSNNP